MTRRKGLTLIGLTGALVVGLVASLVLGPGVPWMVRLRPGLTHRGWIGSDSDDWDFSRLFFGEGIRMHPLSPKAEKEVSPFLLMGRMHRDFLYGRMF